LILYGFDGVIHRFDILFSLKISEKVEYLAKNMGVFWPLNKKYLNVETKWCQEFFEKHG
jgi:hypothetical protein